MRQESGSSLDWSCTGSKLTVDVGVSCPCLADAAMDRCTRPEMGEPPSCLSDEAQASLVIMV